MKRRLAIEVVVVVAMVTAIWALLYTPGYDLACCAVLEGVVLFAIFVSAYVGAFLTGGGANPGRVHVLIGFLIEALAAWAVVRLVLIAWRARSARSASGPGSG